jgi:[NiFe] hydrogenase diaphorase moiety small subunit
MSTIQFKIDGKAITAQPGQTILEAADDNGVYIPRLCAMKGLIPHGGCRICLVKVNGRPQAACTQPAMVGALVENETAELTTARKAILEMLFVEGNHICPACEKSGNCELQALGYRYGVTAPRYPFLFPKREVDASHPDIFIDHNRCVLCTRCVRASRDLDGKHVFELVGRGAHKHVAVNAAARLADTNADATDQALNVCPVGALLKKRVGFVVPVGKRLFDDKPIGSSIEEQSPAE